MAVDVFRNGMNHNVGTVFQGVLDIWAHEGVVHDHRNPMPVGHSRNLCNVHHSHCRVRRRLDPDQLGVIWSNQFLHVQFNAGRERHVNAVSCRNLGEVPVCPPIDIGNRNDVCALGEGLKDSSGGGGAGGEGKGIFCLF